MEGEINVEWENFDGELLRGLLFLRHNVQQQQQGVVILCHGLMTTKESFVIKRLCQLVQQLTEYATLRFDFAGNGDSAGAFDFGGYLKSVSDLRSAVMFVRGQGHSVRAVLGHSMGGNVVLLYASQFDDVPLVVSLSGRFNMRRGVDQYFEVKERAELETNGFVKQKRASKTFRITLDAIERRTSLDMRSYLESFNARSDSLPKMMIVHGLSDQVIPVEDAHSIVQVISDRSHILREIEGADHYYKGDGHIDQVASFIVSELSTPPSSL